MGFFGKFVSEEKTSQMQVISPDTVMKDVLTVLSGKEVKRGINANILYKRIAFKGIADGIGTSTIVANTAVALAGLGLTVCVFDPSFVAPAQDILLKTGYANPLIAPVEKDRIDWLDLPYAKGRSPLHVSKINKNISVLSFYGRGRCILDALDVQATKSLVTSALSQMQRKFDIILIDCCNEFTEVNAACLSEVPHVIQVWNDSPTVIENVDTFIKNCVIMSCPLETMHTVVYSKINGGISTGLDTLLNKYKLSQLGVTSLSENISRLLISKKLLWTVSSSDVDVTQFNECISRIVAHICNLDSELEEDNPPKVKLSKRELKEQKVASKEVGVDVDADALSYFDGLEDDEEGREG